MNSSCETKVAPPNIMIASNGLFSRLLIILCIENSFAAIVSVSGNFLVLVTIWRTSSLHSPSFVLLSGLALSDLAVGLISQPIFVAFNGADIYGNCDLFSTTFNVHLYFATQLLTVTFLTVSASVIDRFLALKIHLRYRELITVRKALFCLLFIWVISSALALWVLIDISNAKIGAITLSTIVLFITVTCYVKIFRIIRYHENQIESQLQIPQNCVQAPVPNLARYRKSVSSLRYIAGFLCVSNIHWVLWVICKFSMNEINENESKLAARVLFSVSYLNSCFNPFLYCWRIGEIRLAMKEQLKKLCC